MTQPANSYLEIADAIGARLCRDAVWVGERCNWLGPSMEPVSGRWAVVERSLGPELYGGTSGIALFLGQLYGMLPERVYRSTCLAAMRHALSRFEAVPAVGRASLYTGWAGMAHACITLALLLGDEDLDWEGMRLFARLGDVALKDHGIDVLGGCAGAIPVLLRAAGRPGQDSLRCVAVRFGDRLLADARRSDSGWSWNTIRIPEEKRQQDILGLSHGAGGIGWALAELYCATGEARFKEGAEQAFAYEQHWFDPEQGNWPDFRGLYEPLPGIPPGPGFMVAWCHGAPGIGLARLRAYQLLGTASYRAEAEGAIRTTARALEQPVPVGAQDDCSLCHGRGSNAELLLYASQVLGRPDLRAVAERAGDYGIREYYADRTPWPCGVRGAGEAPGLFLGLAGIGYFYLRLHDPVKVPPITIVPADSG